MREEGTDSMKYRKSTHLAGVDVEGIIADKGKCILIIKQSYYDTNVNVSGNKTDGYFLEFDDHKPMVVNSGNRKQIAKIYKDLHKCTSTESRNIANWIGLEIELYFDENVKMMGQKTGGIKVKYVLPTNNTDDKGALAMLNECKTLAELKNTWGALSDNEKTLPTVLAKKESLKTKLK
jgi:hypothetical protein